MTSVKTLEVLASLAHAMTYDILDAYDYGQATPEERTSIIYQSYQEIYDMDELGLIYITPYSEDSNNARRD